MIFFRRTAFVALFLFSSFLSLSQTDSCRLRISLLTCGPGNELYSTFGHTGIRVIDSANGMDAVFNYGLFDDTDPYFYLKFTRGIMRYAVGAETFDDFMQEYIEDKRSVTEQELQLSCTQKNDLFNALKENIAIRNRNYDYRFLDDNCTTRTNAIIRKTVHNTIVFKRIIPAQAPTFRQLIHQYLDSGGHSWDKFGIDLLLGAHLDKKVNNEQAMFLPEYLMAGFDSATISGRKLIQNKKNILAGNSKSGTQFSLLSPLFLFSLVAFVFVALSFARSVPAKKTLRLCDMAFYFFMGLLGLLLVTVWAGRVDEVCRNNMNILWAWPTHTVFAFMTAKKTKLISNYFLLSALVALILLIGWPWWPQQFNNAFAPLLLIMAVRGFLISKK
ncbi:MAG: DUF4105 domain-containing protein [Bacteroidetes bacterium]|nr:DUF4105 domain-containing protein [Bacteroidota bacterium]